MGVLSRPFLLRHRLVRPGPPGPPRARLLAIGDDLDIEALAGPLRRALAASA
jgi:hypothetical protein